MTVFSHTIPTFNLLGSPIFDEFGLGYLRVIVGKGNKVSPRRNLVCSRGQALVLDLDELEMVQLPDVSLAPLHHIGGPVLSLSVGSGPPIHRSGQDRCACN